MIQEKIRKLSGERILAISRVCGGWMKQFQSYRSQVLIPTLKSLFDRD